MRLGSSCFERIAEINSALLRAVKTKCDAAARSRVTARGGDEVGQHSVAFAARDATAVVRIFAPGGRCAIRRIRDDQVEAGGLDARDFFLPKVGANCSHRLEFVDCSAARDHLSQRRLDLERDDFARAIKSAIMIDTTPHPAPQLEHSIARGRAREAAEQDRFDRKAVAVPWLDQRDRTVEDRIASFVFVG